MYGMAEKITRGYPIGLGIFWSVCTDKFKIWNLYVKNIMFICSLLTSTSTWHSGHCNRPGGYMSGELKSENIKYRKAPTQRSYHLVKRLTIVPSYITKSQKDISTLYLTILQYSKDPQDRQDHTTKTHLDQQDPLRLLFILECNYNR
jgi:hypothetical protein